jgi:dTDP-4-dehydrorhamnose 3,5-epimerase
VKVLGTALEGVLVVEPTVFADDRGWLIESWNASTFAREGIVASFVQHNHSRSAKGVLRGLHYQLRRPQGKLVQVVAGRIFDVAVDLRRSSRTFGEWTGVHLSAENARMLWIPPGFAHGFLSLEEGSECLYCCTDFYAPQDERTLLWSEPSIAIDWPLDEVAAPRLSAKDEAAPLLAEAETYE